MTARTWLTGLASAALITAAALTATPTPVLADGDPGTNIIGGTNATENYPFAARQLTYYPDLGETGRCTAALVTDRGVTGVVTNAHCVTDFTTALALPAADLTVQVGSIYLDKLTNITPTRAEVQPLWDWGTGTDAFADVAVLVLPKGNNLTGIPLGNLTSAKQWVRLLGWGKTTVDATEPPPVLQQLDTRLTDPSDCAAAGISAGEICVAPAVNGGQSCFGDSGGPALGHARNGWVLLGGGSRETSEDCTGPTVYTDFHYWASWIRDALHHSQPCHPRLVAAGAAGRFVSTIS